MKDGTAKNSPKAAVLSLARLLEEQPAAPVPGWIEPGLLPAQGILFVGGEPKVGKSLLVSNLALALAAGQDRAACSSASSNSLSRSSFPVWRRCAVRSEPLPIRTCW